SAGTERSRSVRRKMAVTSVIAGSPPAWPVSRIDRNITRFRAAATFPAARPGEGGRLRWCRWFRAAGRSSASKSMAREGDRVNLEETLAKVVELSQEELHIVRKRGEEKTPARDHGQDFHEME